MCQPHEQNQNEHDYYRVVFVLGHKILNGLTAGDLCILYLSRVYAALTCHIPCRHVVNYVAEGAHVILQPLNQRT